MKKLLLFISVLLLSRNLLFGQGAVEDYNRAYALHDLYKNKVFFSDVRPVWIEHTHFFWYIRNTPEGKMYMVTDADKRICKNLFDPSKLANKLSAVSGKEVKASALSIDNLQVSRQLDSLRFSFSGSRWTYLAKDDKLIREKGFLGPAPGKYWGNRHEEYRGSVLSPDGKKEAFIRNFNLYIKDRKTGKEEMLSRDGKEGDYYSARIQWSPDCKKIATMKIRPGMKREIFFVESSPADQLQPKLHTREYLKPGDTLDIKQPRIFNIETDTCIIPSMDLYKNQYDLSALEWNADSKALTFEFNQRGHQVYRILELSAETGTVRTLVNEASDTYVNYNRMFRYDLKNGTEMIWMSERDNWNHLYMYNRITGTVKYQITKGEWYVREIIHVDEKKRQIYFSANGMNKKEDPYLIHYYRINMDGTNLTCLTPEEGMHQAWFSQDMNYLVDVYSKTDVPQKAVLRRAKDGRIIMKLEEADIHALKATGWKAPETFVAKGRDGKTDMWGLIFRPSNFNPDKSYPVIEYIYSGPGDQYVPKTFSSWYDTFMPLAELGFIVVQLDAMSTSYRSKSFESICYKNLKDAGLPDRIAWIKAAGEKYSYMDTTRVGIFGASAGGQESMTATLFYPDFYKAAYSSCGCHDNRMDKIWWNEQWMGYPVDESYKASSNVENAHLLKNPLMLVVGEMDENVDPASTMQVVNALIKANKNFELVVLPGSNHTMGGDFGEHKRFDFFVKNLMHKESPAWNLVHANRKN